MMRPASGIGLALLDSVQLVGGGTELCGDVGGVFSVEVGDTHTGDEQERRRFIDSTELMDRSDTRSWWQGIAGLLPSEVRGVGGEATVTHRTRPRGCSRRSAPSC